MSSPNPYSSGKEFLRFVAQMWPVIMAVGALLIGIATTRADVARLETEVAATDVELRKMAERVTRIEANTVNIDRTMTRIEDKLDAK